MLFLRFEESICYNYQIPFASVFPGLFTLIRERTKQLLVWFNPSTPFFVSILSQLLGFNYDNSDCWLHRSSWDCTNFRL
jgi:hypothetical protein